MRETELLQHIYARSRDLSAKFPHILVGPGHDCAVLDIAGNAVLLKTDQLAEGVHFRGDAPIELIARKAMARAVSDIAAAGGRPLASLAGAMLPAAYRHADALFDAMSGWAEKFGCPLVGGDIASWRSGPGEQGLVLSVSILGAPHERRGPVLRSGARAGDAVYVTGALGGSFDAATGLGRHMTFEPRVAEAAWLCDMLGGDLRAMMDISDGLGRDAARLGIASGVRVRVEAERIPRAQGVESWRRAASDGEDYELLFVAAAERVLPAHAPLGTQITRIGTIEPGAGCVVVDGGVESDAGELGWEHGGGREHEGA